MSPIKSMLAVLFALGSAGALAQNQASPTPPPSKPVDSATYGPVLHPQQAPSPVQQAGEANPQAQEERAGQPPTSKHLEVDPSARPAPEPAQPQGTQQPARKDGKDKKKQAQRRPGAVQRIDGTPRILVPDAPPPVAAQSRVAPAPVGPQSTQVTGCMGSACTDINGAGYNAGGPGNAAVSSNGRLCTRNGATMQCF
jgi:hypothetical protein